MDGIVLQGPTHGCVYYQNESARFMTPALIEIKCPFAARDMTILQASQMIKGFPIGIH